MKRSYLFAFIFLLTTFLAGTAAAQDQQSDEDVLLPEIDPQDIEIRSQFKARFPGLQRQPILGFDPTPRVYQIDPDRTPFMESREQVVADLPVSDLSRPDPPAYTPLHYSSDINAFSRLGMGSYVSPEAQFWGVHRINSENYLGGDLDYSSSDGHLENQESSFRFFDANGEYATKLSSQSRLGINGGFQNSFNQMPDYGTGSIIPNDARKEYGGFNIGADFEHYNNTVTGWNAQANIRYFEASLNNAGSTSTGESTEQIYNASVRKQWAGSNVNETFSIQAGAKGGSFKNNSTNSDWLTARGGVSYERLFNYSTRVSADAQVYYTQNQFEDKIYIGPSLTIEQPVADILTLTLEGGAEPYLKSVEQLHSDNRFLNVSNNLRHSYRINGSLEASLEYDDLGSLSMGVQYENISDYPMFVRQNIQGGVSDYRFYTANYSDAYKIRAYAGVTHQLIPEKLWLNTKAYLQSPQIQNGGRLPYEEKAGVNSSIHFRPFDQLSIEAWGDYMGSRRTFQTNEKLDGFLLLGSKVDVQITDRFGAYVKLVNLLDQSYEVWQGYNERPFQAYGGITVKL